MIPKTGLCNIMLHLLYMVLLIMRCVTIHIQFVSMDKVLLLVKYWYLMPFWCHIFTLLIHFSNRIMYPILLGWEVCRSCRMESSLFKYVCVSVIILLLLLLMFTNLFFDFIWYLFKFAFTNFENFKYVTAGDKRLCG